MVEVALGLTGEDNAGLMEWLLYALSMKTCARCKAEKPADRENFSFITSRDRWHPWCKPCCAEDRRRDRAENPERYREIDSKRDMAKVRAQQRARYQADPEKHRAWGANRTPEQQAKYLRNRAEKKATDPAYAEKCRLQQKATRERHGHKHDAQRRAAWQTASPAKRLRTYFTSAICHSLRSRTKGGRSWEVILGFSTDDLRQHLERQFTKGMTWDNYGDWHVDHILPVASFNITSADDAEFKACWSLTNLRPLWAAENMHKKHKRTHLI